MEHLLSWRRHFVGRTARQAASSQPRGGGPRPALATLRPPEARPGAYFSCPRPPGWRRGPPARGSGNRRRMV